MHPYFSFINRLDEQKEDMLLLLEDWANINSGTNNTDGLSNQLKKLKDSFQLLEGSIKEISLPPRRTFNDRGIPTDIPTGKALHIVKRSSAPIQVLLGGHMDTVYGKDSPFQKTSREGKNILRGPGVADMKGGLVVMLNALACLETSSFAEKIGWEVLVNPDEEAGSGASEPLFIQAAKGKKLGLIFEPSFPDGTLVSARKGSVNYTLICRGKSAHVGRDFFRGKNALTALAEVFLKIEEITNEKEGITVNVGFATGGGPINIVPEFALCRINVRMQNRQQEKEIEKRIEQIVRQQTREGLACSLHRQSARMPKPFDARQESLFNQLAKCGKELGLDLKWRPTGGVCDGNILAEQGIGVIDTLGVIGGNIHTEQEYMEIDSLVERSKLTALFLMKLAGEK